MLIPINVLAEENLNDYDALELNLNVNAVLNIENPGDVKDLEAKLNFFPREYEFQTILGSEIKTEPNSNIREEKEEISYSWNYVKEDKVVIDNTFRVNSKTDFIKILEKIEFPLNEDFSDMKQYLSSNELINSEDERIKLQASQIVQGKDDLYDVVFSLAKWTKENIDYSLETLTADAKQDAVWVLENRKGVCDELTILYISMLRSLGVPTKFISGSSYTNTIGGFGNHAWAEVYFPGYGWVAVDPTYGQMGYVDSTHIKMDESGSARDSSISYVWKSNKAKVNPGNLNVSVNVLEKGKLLNFNLEMDVVLLNNKVKAGYVPVMVELENNEAFYLPVSLYLVKGPKIVEDNERVVLLKPGGKARAFYLLEIPEDLKKGFLYSSQVEIKDGFGNSKSSLLEYSSLYDMELNKEQAENKIESLSKEDDNEFTDVKLDCNGIKDSYYSYEKEGKVECLIENNGNTFFDELEVCYLDYCKVFSLPLLEKKTFEFDVNLSNFDGEGLVELKGKDFSEKTYFFLKVLDRPGIVIENLTYPGKLDYDEENQITFTMISKDEIKDMKIFIGEREIFTSGRFVNAHNFEIPFQARVFYHEEPKLIVVYKDKNNAQYTYEEELNVEIENVPWYAGLMEFFRRLV